MCVERHKKKRKCLLICQEAELQYALHTHTELQHKEFHCFTVHFNSLNLIHQPMHFYIQ